MNEEELHALQQQLETQIAAPGASGIGGNDAALQKALQAAQAMSEQMATGQVVIDPTVEPTLFGMTMAALFAGFVLSTLGFGMLMYAKAQRHIIFLVFGVALMGLPFFATTTPWLLGVGVPLVFVPFVLNRFVQF